MNKGYFNSVYIGSWADMYFRHLSRFTVKFISKVKWVTPNFITIFSGFIFIAGCLMLFINIPYHLYYAAFLIFIGYFGDLLDGDLAEKRNMKSFYGGYLDAVADVIKIYFITISLSISTYITTNNIIYIFLGFTICASFLSRFYIKQIASKFGFIRELEKDPQFVHNRFEIGKVWKQKLELKYDKLSKTLVGKLKILWLKNKNVFLVDEAEIAIFTCLAAILNQLVIWIWILVFSQLIIVIFRLFQRGYQLKTGDIKLIQKTYLEI